MSFSVHAKGLFLYSQPVDILNFFTVLSKDVGVKADIELQKEWIKINGAFSLEDKEFLKDFREVKKLYDTKTSNKFSEVFFSANSFEEALTNLRRIMTQDEVTRVVNCIKHFRTRAISFIQESNAFNGKIKELEKKLLKTKFQVVYNDASKFFGQKVSSQAKIYFVWSTKENIQISYYDNIVLVGIHPHVNLYEYFDVNKVLDIVMTSLFSSLTKTQEKNFMAIINQNCSKNAHEVIKHVLGKMHYQYINDKKGFDPYTENFLDKKLNLHAITIHSLYESELAAKNNIFGSFANKVNYLCALIN